MKNHLNKETIDRFREVKKVVTGISGVFFNVFIAVFHVFKVVRVFSGCNFSSGIEGYSCEGKINIYPLILERKTKSLRNKEIVLVNVQGNIARDQNGRGNRKLR